MSRKKPESLRDVAQAALDRHPGASGRELDRVAKKSGLRISYTTINHLAAGTYKSRPSKATLAALAVLSGYPEEQVYLAAEVPLPLRPLRDDLPEEADLLTGPQRRVVVDTIRLLAQQNRELEQMRRTVEGQAEASNVRELPTATRARQAAERKSARTTGKPPKGDPNFTD